MVSLEEGGTHMYEIVWLSREENASSYHSNVCGWKDSHVSTGDSVIIVHILVVMEIISVEVENDVWAS